MKRLNFILLPFVFITLLVCTQCFSKNNEGKNEDDIEKLLIESMMEITDGNLNAALKTIDSIIEKKPNFKLAHLIKGDIYQTYAHGLRSFGGSENLNNEILDDLKEEAQKRIKGFMASDEKKIYIGDVISLSNNDKYLIYVDAKNSRLYLFENDKSFLYKLFDVYASIGKNGFEKEYEGDKKTPVGVYSLGAQIKKPLDDFYGAGAFPIDYPNSYDKLLKRTGHGIWIHGTPTNTYSRAPQSSDGCVVISNEDFRTLQTIINNVNVKVIIAPENYDNYFSSLNKNKHDSFLKIFNSWRYSWESKEFLDYLAFYSSDATYNNKKYNDWTEHKNNVFKKTKQINVMIENLSIIDHPNNNDELKHVEFKQTYKSDLISNTTVKSQIWQKFKTEWRIISESTI